MKARTQAANQLRAVLVTAPQSLRDRLRALSLPQLVDAAARARPGPTRRNRGGQQAGTQVPRHPIPAAHGRNLHARHRDRAARPPGGAAAHGDQGSRRRHRWRAAGRGRRQSRAAAQLVRVRAPVGVAPIPASSGKTNRHRLNRAGNRDANRALYVLALGRLSYDERTRAYAVRRAGGGKTKREIIRCLKRYLAREVFRASRRRTDRRASSRSVAPCA